MRKLSRTTIIAAATGVAMAMPLAAFAVETIEGKVTGTELTACDFATKRCQGYLTLDAKVSGKPDALKVRVVGDIPIRKGSETVLLPTLRGNVVSVSYEGQKGENVAKSIEVLQGRK